MIGAGAATAACRAPGRRFAVLGNDGNIQPAERPCVRGIGTVGAHDEDLPQLFHVGGAHLRHATVEGARHAVGPQNHFEPRRQIERESAPRNRVEIRRFRLQKSLHRLLGRARGNQSCRACRVQQALRAQIIGVGVAGPLARKHAYAAAHAGALAGGLHNLLIDAERGRRHRLKVKVSVIATGRKRFAQTAFQQSAVDAKFGLEILFVRRCGRSGQLAHCGSSVRCPVPSADRERTSVSYWMRQLGFRTSKPAAPC